VPSFCTTYLQKNSSPSPFTHFSLKTPLTPNLQTSITPPNPTNS
jgi:hypothetical protein